MTTYRASSSAAALTKSRKLLWAATLVAATTTAPNALLADPLAPSAADPPYVATTAITALGGDKITSFDISFVDPAINRYFLANRTSKAIIVVDTTTDKVVAQFKPGFVGFTGDNNTSGPDGVLTVDHKEIWAGDGNSTVKVLDINTGALAHTINTGGSFRADEMCYDPVDHIVAAANNADNPPFLTFISTATYTVLGTVKFDGTGGTPKATNGIEQCQWNHRDGKIYVSVPEINGPGDNSVPGGVAVLDPITRVVERTISIPVASCTGPQGLAIGPGHELGLGCNVSPTAANTAIIDERDGTVLSTFTNDGGGDEIWFNPGNNKYYLAARQAPAGERLFIFDADSFAVQAPSTSPASNAHSVAVDPVFNKAYVPISSAATGKICSSAGGVDAQGCILVYTPASAPTSLYAAVTPNSRTTTVNQAVTAFASIINAGQVQATSCSIAPPAGFPANFSYQTTNSANSPTGSVNTPVNIGPGQTQSFFFAMTPTRVVQRDVPLQFVCTNSNPAPIYPGLDTFLITASSTSIPDMLSIAATQTNDGNIVFPTFGVGGGSATQVMAAAAINIGAAGTVTFAPSDTPFGSAPRTLGLSLSICQTDSTTGACLAPATPSVTIPVTQNQKVTFTIFATRTAMEYPYVPAYNRLFIRASISGATVTPVGEASVAIKMQSASVATQ